MPLEIISVSHTGTSSTSVPVNSHFIIEFNEPIKTGDYHPNPGSKFKLFKLPDYSQVGLTAGIVLEEPEKVYLQPLVNLDDNTSYQLVVIGGNNGVSSINGEQLAANHVTNFTTNSEAPVNTITIEDGLVTVVVNPEPEPEPEPETPEPTEPPDYVDRDSLANSEEGLADFYYDDDVYGPDSVRVITSSPKHKSIWNQNVERIRVRWDRNISIQETGEIRVRKMRLPFETGIGPDLDLPISDISAHGNIIDVYINETGVVGNYPTTNHEYILSFPEGSVVDLSNVYIYNQDTDIKFMGQLWPMFATPDQVVSKIATFDPALAEELDKYEITKAIHQLSIYVSDLLSGQELTEEKLYWIAHYIICRVAYEMMIGPLGIVKTVSSRSILGQSVRFNVVNDKSIDNPLRDCMKKAELELGIDRSSVAANISVKSANTPNYPARDHTWVSGIEASIPGSFEKLSDIERLIRERD